MMSSKNTTEWFRLGATVGDEPVESFARYMTNRSLRGWLVDSGLSVRSGLNKDALVAMVVDHRRRQSGNAVAKSEAEKVAAAKSTAEKLGAAIKLADRITTTLKLKCIGLDESATWGDDGDADAALLALQVLSDHIHGEGN